MIKWCKCGHMKGDHNVEGCMEWIGSSNVGTRGICDCKTFRLSHERKCSSETFFEGIEVMRWSNNDNLGNFLPFRKEFNCPHQ